MVDLFKAQLVQFDEKDEQSIIYNLNKDFDGFRKFQLSSDQLSSSRYFDQLYSNLSNLKLRYGFVTKKATTARDNHINSENGGKYLLIDEISYFCIYAARFHDSLSNFEEKNLIPDYRLSNYERVTDEIMIHGCEEELVSLIGLIDSIISKVPSNRLKERRDLLEEKLKRIRVIREKLRSRKKKEEQNKKFDVHKFEKLFQNKHDILHEIYNKEIKNKESTFFWHKDLLIRIRDGFVKLSEHNKHISVELGKEIHSYTAGNDALLHDKDLEVVMKHLDKLTKLKEGEYSDKDQIDKSIAAFDSMIEACNTSQQEFSSRFIAKYNSAEAFDNYVIENLKKVVKLIDDQSILLISSIDKFFKVSIKVKRRDF